MHLVVQGAWESLDSSQLMDLSNMRFALSRMEGGTTTAQARVLKLGD